MAQRLPCVSAGPARRRPVARHLSRRRSCMIGLSRRTGSLLLAVLLIPACQTPTDRSSLTIPPPSFAVVPSQGSPTALDVGTWNLEWFGHTGFGPTNEQLQLQNVRDVMAGADMDIWGLEEVVDAAQFQQLVAGMPGYTGVLANDPVVVDGAAYYSDFSNTEQKVALVWRTSIATLLGAKVILKDQNSNFAGRPPVEFSLRLTLNGVTEDVIVIVLHAKAGSDDGAWSLRNAASPPLKSYL